STCVTKPDVLLAGGAAIVSAFPEVTCTVCTGRRSRRRWLRGEPGAAGRQCNWIRSCRTTRAADMKAGGATAPGEACCPQEAMECEPRGFGSGPAQAKGKERGIFAHEEDLIEVLGQPGDGGPNA